VLKDADLKALTKIEKLRLLEALWSDLTEDDSQINSPHWHHEELQKSKRLHEEGKAVFSDWGDAKERMRSVIPLR